MIEKNPGGVPLGGRENNLLNYLDVKKKIEAEKAKAKELELQAREAKEKLEAQAREAKEKLEA